MTLAELLGELMRRIAELERRQDGTIKRGRVVEVDPENARVRLRLNEESASEPFLSPWVPYAQIAGALKVHTPPSVDQQMTLFSETGDLQQGLAVPMTWSDKNEAPSKEGDEHVLTFGDVRFDLKNNEVKVTTPKMLFECEGVTLEITGSGVKINGGRVEHDGRNIGSSHIHGGVTPGAANTDVPAN